MATISDPKVLGFMDGVIQFIQDNQAAIQAKGLNTSTLLAELTDKRDSAAVKDSAENTARVALKNAGTEKRLAFDDAYDSTSSALDAMVGALGKNTALAKQAARLRSEVIAAPRRRTLSTPPT